MSEAHKFSAVRARVVRPVYVADRIDLHNDVEINVRYVNRTNAPIIISRRDGVRFVVRPHLIGFPTEEISIYVTLKGPVDVIKDALARLHDDTNASSPERVSWLRAIDRTRDLLNKDATVVQATVEYMLSAKHLDELGGRVYMSDQDIVVEWLERDHRPVNHPFCQGEQDKKSLDAVFTGCGKDSMVMLFRAIDNTGRRQYSDRYMNIGGKIYRIPVEQDSNLHNGIYVTTRKPVTDDPEDTRTEELSTEHYAFAKADDLFHLHTTVENAINGGPLHEVLKDKLNHHAANQKVEEARLRQEQLYLEDTLQRLRYERDIQKTDHDNKMNTQKIVLEWIKTAGTLVTVGLSLYAAFRKISPA